jgi:psiF repeat
MGTAWAQTSAPSPMSQDQKKAISKSCTDQANAKGLHGKARRKFRSECKRVGGKSQ